MLKLSLLRHAKSSWAKPGPDAPSLADFDRPLAPRGLDDAPRMGRHMASIGLVPELVLCSPAARTRATADLALAAYGAARPAIVFERAIYQASLEDLLGCLHRVPDIAREAGQAAAPRHVLIIGHNPGMQDLVLALAARPLEASHMRLEEKLPTACLVVMDLAFDDWSRIEPRHGRIVHLMTPRDLDKTS